MKWHIRSPLRPIASNAPPPKQGNRRLTAVRRPRGQQDRRNWGATWPEGWLETLFGSHERGIFTTFELNDHKPRYVH